MNNLSYDSENKRLVCDSDPEALEYEFCAAPEGTENWDSIITPVNYRSVADKTGEQRGKGRLKVPTG
jgi:hypothetical protein